MLLLSSYRVVPILTALSRCALRTGSRLLSGAQMEDYSMLLEHALLASGDIAEAGAVYAGWPAHQLEQRREESSSEHDIETVEITELTKTEKSSEKGSSSIA